MPRISVVIPLYNKEKDIRKTLESLLAQTFTDFEAIIVDDGSTDQSVEAVLAIKDERIKLFKKTNEGVALTRNYGVANAASQLIAFLDADDYWYPSHLSNIISLSEKFPEAKWFATAYEKKFSDTFIRPLQAPIMEQKDWFGMIPNYFENCYVDSIVWTSAVAFDVEFFTSLNGFDASITNGAGEDTDLWIRAALQEKLAFCTTVSARHNQDVANRISHTPTRNRVFFNPDNYKKESRKNHDLKKYLDLNRYSFALQHKLAGDLISYQEYVGGIDFKNLNKKQRLLLKAPKPCLRTLLKIKRFLNNRGSNISSFN